MDNLLTDNIALLIPIAILQFGLQIFSLVKLASAEKVKSLNKPLWAVIIILGGFAGSLVFLILKPYED